MKNAPLETRIAALRAEINEFIDARAAEVGKTCPGVPVSVIRKSLVGFEAGCECRALLKVSAERQQEAA